MINPQWLELPMSRTNFHGSNDVQAIEVRLYLVLISLKMLILKCHLVWQAVCCSDEIHCCPKGTECDLTHSKCVGEDRVADMAVKQMAVWQQTQSKQTSDLKTVICPDGKSQCEDGQTCCQLASGAYGCCPLPKVSARWSLYN